MPDEGEPQLCISLECFKAKVPESHFDQSGHCCGIFFYPANMLDGVLVIVSGESQIFISCHLVQGLNMQHVEAKF